MSTFSHIFGQDTAIEWLGRAYLSDHLPHGLIFAGPIGVGKTTTARALAKLFLCEKPKEVSPCNKCDSCRVFDAGNHPDLHIVTKELIRYHDKTGKSKGIDLSINVVRPEVIEPASRKSAMNRGKVFLIKQAELMTTQAQNALLKTLEEPAGRALLILLTDQPEALLPTIRSRCQTLRFAALDPAVSAKELTKRGIAADVARRAVTYTNGSLGLALKWIEDGVIDRAEALTKMLNDVFAGRPATDFPVWLKAAADAYAAKQIDRDPLGSEDQARREGIGVYLQLAGDVCRRRMNEVAESGNVDALDQACDIIDALRQAEVYLDANVNVSLVFQQLAATLDRAAV